MGFIREPEGVDFVIQSEPLTEKDRKDISQYIQEYKSKTLKIKRERKSATKKQTTNA